MKLSLKVIAISLGITGALLFSTWGITFLYWHLRIQSALRTWESESCRWNLGWRWRQSGAPPESFRVLEQAGCRALPYLVGALDLSGKLEFQEGLIDRTIQVLAGPVPRDKTAVAALNDRYDQWGFNKGDTQDQCGLKSEKVRSWWQDHGASHHRWWHVWSSKCDFR